MENKENKATFPYIRKIYSIFKKVLTFLSTVFKVKLKNTNEVKNPSIIKNYPIMPTRKRVYVKIIGSINSVMTSLTRTIAAVRDQKRL